MGRSRSGGRRRDASRERDWQRDSAREQLREAKERALKEREPSASLVVQGLPDSGIDEKKLEGAAWEMAVKAGSSMPEGVNFAYDKNTQKFRGFGLIEFPHKEAAKIFKDHCGGVLEVDGFNLALRYHHPAGERSRSRSREHGRDEPSGTLIVKGIASTTSEAGITAAFQPFASIRDIRHFPRRNFAFVQFHSKEEASVALARFEKDCRSKIDGNRVQVGYAQEREREDRRFGPASSFLQKQEVASAQAAAELEKFEKEQVKRDNASKALSGVNAGMWASYMQSVEQTETVQSANTFEYDKESGFYLDSVAKLYYDPNTTYFFKMDYSKYFVYDHEEKLLCHVDKEGVKIPDGERRPMPSAKTRSEREREEREREREKEREPREREKDRRARSSDRGDRGDRGSRGDRPERDRPERDRDDRGDRRSDRERHSPGRRSPQRRSPPREGASLLEKMPISSGNHKPIHFAGGDPLARLAPAPQPVQGPQPKKKRRPQSEGVMGLVPLSAAPPAPLGKVQRPGAVQLAPKPGPVTVYSAAAPAAVAAPAPAFPPEPPSFAFPPQPPAPSAPGAAPSQGEWICELCMRKFGTEQALQRHEQISDLHKQNLAKFTAASRAPTVVE